MYFKMAKRALLETDKRLVWKFAWNMGLGGIRSVQKFKRRLKRGEYFPPFLYISIINSCKGLRCQGCWVDVAAKQEKIDAAAMHRMIDEAKGYGNRFFGILGGEPFMHHRTDRDHGRAYGCLFPGLRPTAHGGSSDAWYAAEITQTRASCHNFDQRTEWTPRHIVCDFDSIAADSGGVNTNRS